MLIGRWFYVRYTPGGTCYLLHLIALGGLGAGSRALTPPSRDAGGNRRDVADGDLGCSFVDSTCDRGLPGVL